VTLQGPGNKETVTGFIVDQSCAGRRGMWTNANCTETCIKGGDKPVLVTEDGKVYQFATASMPKITAETYAKAMTVSGMSDGEVMVVETIKPAE
jgi:hypothetical protein